jgi:hypothetical protein
VTTESSAQASVVLVVWYCESSRNYGIVFVYYSSSERMLVSQLKGCSALVKLVQILASMKRYSVAGLAVLRRSWSIEKSRSVAIRCPIPSNLHSASEDIWKKKTSPCLLVHLVHGHCR